MTDTTTYPRDAERCPVCGRMGEERQVSRPWSVPLYSIVHARRGDQILSSCVFFADED